MGSAAEDAALAWLVGGVDGAPPDGPASANQLPGAPGLLARLSQTFQGDPCGPSEQLAVGAGIGRLNPPDQANSATCSIAVQPVRLQTDGSTVTTALGLLLPVGTVIRLTGHPSMRGAQFLGTVAGAVVDVLYFT